MPHASAQSDILILGGGPAGAAAATVLARAGRAVTLVEREAAPKHKVCGEFLSAEALHFLAELGIDPRAHNPGTIQTVRLASSGHVTEAALPFPARSLSRRCLDALLLQRAEQAGANLLRGVSVESLTPLEGGRWLASLSNGQPLTATRAILASGKHDLRGIPRPEGAQGDLVALKMYFRLSPDQTEALGSAVELLLHPAGYTGLQLVEEGVANLCGLVRRRHLARLGGWVGMLDELRQTNPHARQRLLGAEPLLERPLAISSIPYGFVRREALSDTLYAVGDQAAVIPSFTGDGMSLALYTGFAAAWAIISEEPASVFQDRLYRQLRGQVFRATVLSRALVHQRSRDLLVAGARLWPRGIRVAASITRLSAAAMCFAGIPV